MRPVCVHCRVFMIPLKNDRGFMEMADGKDYRLWSTDEYRCPKCAVRVLSGFGAGPISESHQGDFSRQLDSYKDNLIRENTK